MRIVGITIPDNKKIKIALTYIYGIGATSAEEILENTKIDPEKRTKDLETKEVNLIQKELDKNYTIEGELRQQKKQNIERLKDIDSYRGSRHEKNLPARGQTSRVNSRTVRGNKRQTVTSGKRKVELK